MTLLEYLTIILFLALLLPKRGGGNINPPPTGPRPKGPFPAPPPKKP